MATRVFVVAEHAVLRRRIVESLAAATDLRVVGEAGTAAHASTAVPISAPDVVLLDVRLPDRTGVALCRELQSRHPSLRCLLLTAFADDDALLALAGAAGFVLKHILGQDLLTAIRAVARGHPPLGAHTAAALVHRLRAQREAAESPRALSHREQAVLELIGQGLTNVEISDRLAITDTVVQHTVTHLLTKLGRHGPTPPGAGCPRTTGGVGNPLAVTAGPRARNAGGAATAGRHARTERGG
jgi:two-component system, NarL family, response regulator DevR